MGVYLIGWLVAWLRPRAGDDPSILLLTLFLTISGLTAGPLLFYVRLVRRFVASVVTGAAMVSLIAWAMVLSWAAGWILDKILLRYRPA